MSINFNEIFNRLNTNTQGDSAKKLDSEEVRSAKQNNCVFEVEEGMTSETFAQRNKSNAGKVSVFDADANQTVSIEEQKATISDILRNIWDSAIARFFKDNIKYDDSDAKSTDARVEQRQNGWMITRKKLCWHSEQAICNKNLK